MADTASAKYKSQVIDFTWLFCFLESPVCHLVCHQTLAVAECNKTKLNSKHHTALPHSKTNPSLLTSSALNAWHRFWRVWCRSALQIQALKDRGAYANRKSISNTGSKGPVLLQITQFLLIGARGPQHTTGNGGY